MRKLAIVLTHPIQYYVPLFQRLAKECDLMVLYTWGEGGTNEKFDPAFKKQIAWDLPLLEGYPYELLENTAKDTGSHHFFGIVTPKLIEQIHAFDPDAILIYGWAYQSHLKILRHFKEKIPIWFRGDSNLIDEKNGIKQVLRSLLLKWVYKYVDKAFYVGEANKEYYQKFGLKAHQLIFAPHAVDNDRFAEDRNDEAEKLRASLNIKKDDILILFAGKFEQKKNPELLLEAFIEMVKESEVRGQKSEEQDENEERLAVRVETLEEKLIDKERSFAEATDIKSAHVKDDKMMERLEERKKDNKESVQSINLCHQPRSENQVKIHLLFVGNGGLEESLKNKVSSLSFDSAQDDIMKYEKRKDTKKAKVLKEETTIGEKPFDSAQDNIAQDDNTTDDNEKDKGIVGKRSFADATDIKSAHVKDDNTKDDNERDDNTNDDKEVQRLQDKEKSFDSAQDDNAKDETSYLLSKNIHFMEFQNQTQMPVVYQACDLFCLPSQGPGETWGLAVNEAMACGKAILVSDKVGCAIDLVKQNMNGAIFESNNLDDLVYKLKFLCEDKNRLVAFGQQSKNIIQNWTIENQVKIILDTLSQNP